MKQTKNLGFTMIELLLVISILALLSSVILVQVKLVRSQGRDAKRAQDLNRIGQSQELYFADNGKYPELPGSYYYPLYSEGIDTLDYTWTPLKTALSPYMSTLPVSNAPGQTGMFFKYYTGGTSDVCISGYGGNGITNHILVKSQGRGFALLATMESNEVLAYSDGGALVNLYERYGGNYVVTSC